MKKNLELECTSCQLSRQQMRTGRRQHKDRSAELSLSVLCVSSIHSFQYFYFFLEQAGNPAEHVETD